MLSRARCISLAALLFFLGVATAAQDPESVPLTSEPHHHLVLDNNYVRVFHVELDPHTGTLYHEHNLDYFFVSLGDADLFLLVPGEPEKEIHLKDGEIHFSKGYLVHKADNRSDATFRNFTIEFKHPQQNIFNGCAQVIPGALHCSGTAAEAPAKGGPGYEVVPQFESEEAIVTMVKVDRASRYSFPNPGRKRLIATMDDTRGRLLLQGRMELEVRPDKEIWIEGAAQETFINTGNTPARFLNLEFKTGGKQ